MQVNPTRHESLTAAANLDDVAATPAVYVPDEPDEPDDLPESAVLLPPVQALAPGGAEPDADVLDLGDVRLEQLRRWHGTDETHLPPASTLKNLSRDTVAALYELQSTRERLEGLRTAMSRAFWATDFRDVHEILLTALGPPPDDVPS